MAHPLDQGNEAQSDKLTVLNNMYGVDRWQLEGSELHIWTDDDDECMVHTDGTVTWKEVA